MRQHLAGCLLLSLWLIAAPAQAAEDREAFAHPWAGLSGERYRQFLEGRSLMRQSWIVAPAQDELHDGLGPLYNQLACISCHPKNGRGRSPNRPDERMASMLVRLSLPGPPGEAPRPHPAYGDQLNEEGIPGVPGEGLAYIDWLSVTVRLDDGTRVMLRKPQLRFEQLAYGPLDGALSSPRIGPALIGMGLIDAVPDAALLALAALAKPDGVQGRVNRVTGEDGKPVLGRFGLKANAAHLRQQIANAMLGDLGITSTLHPKENCMPAQPACRGAASGGHPELSDAQLDALTSYLSLLAVPLRTRDDAVTQRGERLFARAGCAVCHRSELQTGAEASDPLLARRRFSPYTDLLLHDMGEGLSDGRPDFSAGPRDWRTAPLWGIGRIEAINEHTQFLHDGRARDLQEAILWHDGEAQAARRRYAALPAADREALLEFLHSL